MEVSLCNCNHHFSFLPPKTLVNPSAPLQNCQYPYIPFKSLRRRTSIFAAEADIQSVPKASIQRIAEKLRSLGFVEESTQTREETSTSSPSSPGEFFVPLPTRLPKYRVGHTLDTSWSTPENPIPEPGSGNAMQRFHEVRRGFVKEREEEKIRKRNDEKGSVPSLAELTLPQEELRRLRSIGIELRKKLKVGKAGITEGIVNGIHERWRRSEMVKIMCEDICRLNMKRTHDMLERKTGGLVIWRSGSIIILYRGPNYKYPYFLTDHSLSNDSSSEESLDSDMDQRIPKETDVHSSVTNAVESSGPNSITQNSHPPVIRGVGLPNRVRFQLPGEAQLAEEADALLEGLGPRFNDWWGYSPLPVDADLLPAVIPGYKKPFRLLPYGVKPKLTNDEMTTLRRLGRPLPCHFALGRNRKHQGLAAAIVMLWEKCEIAKIAVKRGVQNTNSDLMAEELKLLTGGTLLSRDREFIVFYRGKNFLPAAVSSAIEERRKYGMDATKTSIVYNLNAKEQQNEVNNATDVEYNEESKLKFAEAEMKRTSIKLSMALEKKARAEKLLAELEKVETCQPAEIDKEGITEEERYMLRKVGLRMKPFLLLGRRGVFDGTVENMHLHWKYRELVKVCIGRRSIEEIHGIARTLEAESGGILVAVERVSRGYAIIVYRGKNYKRPASLRPQTLLSKREAMKRSLEAQRRESLKLHVLKLNKNIDALNLRLSKKENTKDMPASKDFDLGLASEQKINENEFDEEVFCKDPQSDGAPYFEDHVNEENRESFEADAASGGPDYFTNTSKGSTHIIEHDIPGDVSAPSEAKPNYLFETTSQDLQPGSIFQKSKDSLIQNEQKRNIELPYNLQLQAETSSSTSAYILPNKRSMDSEVGYQNAKLDRPIHKSMSEKPAVMPSRGSQLSNKERLLLRKQALKMKKQPVLAVGKSNFVTGVAKAIKAHFQKHSLAIVNIKGRAKGTSVQEVIYNLEQATGAVLVSQEPSKIILYRRKEAGAKADQARNDSVNEEVIARPVVSPELISAIRLECGLDAANEKHDASEI